MQNLKPWKLRLYYANYNLFVFSMLAIPVSRRTDAGMDRGRIDDAVFRVARLL